MRFESDEPGKFRFILEAVDDFGLTVLRGRDAADVVRMLSAQNGATPMLPRWAYGYMQSRERYKTVEETVRRFRRENLELDCIILDWRTWQGNRWDDKAPDPERFPSVPAMMDALHALHAHLIVSVWPNMANSGQDHAEFEAAHQFLPNCDTYDAFNPDARRLYAEQCECFWGSGGVDGFWDDSSESFTDPDWNGAQKRPEETRYRLINDAAARSIDETRISAYALYHAQGIYAIINRQQLIHEEMARMLGSLDLSNLILRDNAQFETMPTDYYWQEIKLREQAGEAFMDEYEDTHPISLIRTITCPACGARLAVDLEDYLWDETCHEDGSDNGMGADMVYSFDSDDACRCDTCGKLLRVSGWIREYPVGAYDSENIDVEPQEDEDE